MYLTEEIVSKLCGVRRFYIFRHETTVKVKVEWTPRKKKEITETYMNFEGINIKG